MNDRTLIVGGGLAGLSCARELGPRAIVLEASGRLGGLCRSEEVGGFTFDWTGHWLHLRDPAIRALAESRWLAGNLLEVERRAVIFSEGRWTRFPYQQHLAGLPPETICECLEGYVEATLGEAGRGLRERPPRHAADFVRRHLGTGFERRFLRPYNEKLFQVPLEELSPDWGGRFIPRPGLREVLRGALGLEDAEGGYNARFLYPRQGGIEPLARGLAADARAAGAELRVGVRVEAIDLGRRLLRTRDSAGREEELGFDGLVLTLPLREAAERLVEAPEAVRSAAARLRSVSVTTVEIGADDVGGPLFHWAYFPEPRFRFYRVGSPSEVNPALAPAGCRSFAVEIAHRGPLDAAPLIAGAVASLAELGLLDPARVRVARSRTIPVAYVLFDQQWAAARALLFEAFAAAGVRLAGRYGLWEYSSMEDAIVSGRAAARSLIGGPP